MEHLYLWRSRERIRWCYVKGTFCPGEVWGSNVYSVSDFKLLRRLSLVADVVTTAFSQLQATTSNSFHAIITLFVSRQSLHSKHHRINKSLRFKKTRDWHIFVYKLYQTSVFHGYFTILNLKWLEWWKKHCPPLKMWFCVHVFTCRKKCCRIPLLKSEKSVHFLNIWVRRSPGELEICVTYKSYIYECSSSLTDAGHQDVNIVTGGIRCFTTTNTVLATASG